MLVIFGASVTQQKNGFASILKNEITEMPVKVMGYGGMHLNNAAICFIDRVCREKPTYCLIDWFSTGYIKCDTRTRECIDTIIFKLEEVECKPIFLFIPHKDISLRQDYHFFCKKVLESRGAPFIDVSEKVDHSELDKVLKDSVHTTDYGSALYSKIIASIFLEKKDLLPSPIYTNKTKYTDIKCIEIEKEFDKKIALIGKCEVIGFLLTIGPHSGAIKVTNCNEIYQDNTSDKWCHYNRKHFNLSMKVSGNVLLDILQENAKDTKLVIHKIFYIGDYLKIENLQEAHNINKYLLAKENFISRLKHYKKKISSSLRL
jgi:hypothetical protein